MAEADVNQGKTWTEEKEVALYTCLLRVFNEKIEQMVDGTSRNSAVYRIHA